MLVFHDGREFDGVGRQRGFGAAWRKRATNAALLGIPGCRSPRAGCLGDSGCREPAVVGRIDRRDGGALCDAGLGGDDLVRAAGVDLDAAQVRREFDEWLASIKQYLVGIVQEVAALKPSLHSEATRLLNARIAKLQKDDDLLAGLGFGQQRAAS